MIEKHQMLKNMISKYSKKKKKTHKNKIKGLHKQNNACAATTIMEFAYLFLVGQPLKGRDGRNC